MNATVIPCILFLSVFSVSLFAQSSGNDPLDAIFENINSKDPVKATTGLLSKTYQQEIAFSDEQLEQVLDLNDILRREIKQIRTQPYEIDLGAENPFAEGEAMEQQIHDFRKSHNELMRSKLLPNQLFRYKQLVVWKSLSSKNSFGPFSSRFDFDEIADIATEERRALDAKSIELQRKFEDKLSQLWMDSHQRIRTAQPLTVKEGLDQLLGELGRACADQFRLNQDKTMSQSLYEGSSTRNT